jgi:hypothetical protein
VCARVLVADRGLGRASRALADENGSRFRERLDPRRSVDEIAGDHPLAFGADRHRGFAREHRGSGTKISDADLLAECGRHHGIADELLDGSAEALDDEARALEVAREQLAHVLGVALLRERSVADEIGEEDGDEATFGCRRPARRRRLRGQLCPAFTAEAVALLVRRAARWACESEGGTALRAELPTLAVDGSAGWTCHGGKR